MAKLIDILARELKRWPNDWVVCSQDSDSYIAGYSDPDLMEFSKGNWLGDNNFLHGGWLTSQDIAELSSDYSTAIITRSEWQAAVDALNAPKVVEWDGLGNPPARLACEYRKTDAKYRQGFVAVTVLCYGKEKCFLQHEASKNEFTEDLSSVEFRPIRTAEQIAAEEREKAIKDMMEVTSDGISCIGQDDALALYKAGYRKQ